MQQRWRTLELDAGLLADADAIADEAEGSVTTRVAARHYLALADTVEVDDLKVGDWPEVGELLQRLQPHEG